MSTTVEMNSFRLLGRPIAQVRTHVHRGLRKTHQEASMLMQLKHLLCASCCGITVFHVADHLTVFAKIPTSGLHRKQTCDDPWPFSDSALLH